ncbi:MAG: polysaccharide biosynthesis C-terminal domain-containing protein, partial [Bacteroidales bacterium]|nr:polysaccharide biosynthesis C-terminal domain-containing protein [Bacteroidales bacterium]
ASYYFSRLSTSKLATAAYLWSFLVSAVGGLVLLATGQLQTAPFVFVVSTLLGIVTFHNSLFVGDQRINHYNLITLLQPTLLIVCMLLFHWIWPQLSYNCYFLGQIVSLTALIALSTHLRRKMGIHLRWDFDRDCNRQLFNYGWKTELSNVLQFFNYRLTYYLLAYYLGKGSVGIFSIGVSIAEASWIVSRSVSLVLFSNVLTQGNTASSRRQTLQLALLSLGVSAACIGAILLLPKSLFAFIFGPEFGEAKRVVAFLAPGVFAIAFSNVLDNFFSAIRHLNLLLVRSCVGLLFTLCLSLWLIPRWQMDGACIVNSTAYIMASAVLLLYFLSGKSKTDLDIEGER